MTRLIFKSLITGDPRGFMAPGKMDEFTRGAVQQKGVPASTTANAAKVAKNNSEGLTFSEQLNKLLSGNKS